MGKPKGHEVNEPQISPYLRGFERLPKALEHAARLQRTRNGEFYLCVVSSIEVAQESVPSHKASERVIALDPGVRSFMTGFSPGKEGRSEERRVGKECVSTCRSRWSAYH